MKALKVLSLPLVLWHGLGDSFEGMQELREAVQQHYPGTFVHAVALSDEVDADRRATFFGKADQQVQQVCEQLACIKELQDGFDGIGFSQGGQFLRAYVERCNAPPMRRLVTFGAQHNGIAKGPRCGDSDWLCKSANSLLESNTWSAWVQSHIIPAQYFRNGEAIDTYLQHSSFLADINNEREVKNMTYAQRLSRLQTLVMIMFADDDTVVPKVSSHFGEFNFTSGQTTRLEDRPIFKEDWIGLRELADRNGLKYVTIAGAHMRFNESTFLQIVETFLANKQEEVVEDHSSKQFYFDQ